MDRRRDVARHQFDAACAAAGIGQGAGARDATARWVELTGNPDRIVAEQGCLADLIVFSAQAARPGDDLRPVVEAAMLGAGRPVLLAPAGWSREVGRRIAVAWNGRAEAARALALAMPMVEAAHGVVVLSAGTRRTRFETTEGLTGYLRSHGVECERQRVAVERESVGAALLRAAGKADADLLVMGGYGHSRLAELVLGGVTNHVLAHTELPVLIAH